MLGIRLSPLDSRYRQARMKPDEASGDQLHVH
jgi:hypothetical protein